MQIAQLIAKHLRNLKTRNYSPYTIRTSKYCLLDLNRFLAEVGVDVVEQLSTPVLEEYQQDLSFRLTRQGKLLGLRSQEKRLSCAKVFSRFLYEKDYLASDLGTRVKLPQRPRNLPKIILEEADIRKMFEAADLRTNRGYRNRVILEILYDTGIRRLELALIKTHDLDLKGGYLRVSGKGSKERVVPVSSRVAGLIHNYLQIVRPALVSGEDEGWLIVNRWGGRMDPNGVWAVVKRCATLAKIKKNVSTHTFRHTCATHMLKAGAPIRHIQELLGHESLESTQIYTKVTINDLKEIHARYHPSETMMEKR